MSTQIGNQVVAVDIEAFGTGLVYVRDPSCPWVTTQKEWDETLAVLADDTFMDRTHAYQELCDRIRPIASQNDAVDMYDAAMKA